MRRPLTGLGAVLHLGVGVAPVAAAGIPPCGGRPATIVGTQADDLLEGTAGNDVIVGLGGNDRVIGFEGDDRLCGGPGADHLEGGGGDDSLDGGHGADAIHYQGAPAGVTVHLQIGLRFATGEGSGWDHIESIEQAFGSRFDDRLEAGIETSDLWAGRGDDELINFAGLGTSLIGGPGDDWLYAAGGSSTLEGGPGDDLLERWPTSYARMDGGPGDDTFDTGATRAGASVTFEDAPRGITANLKTGEFRGWGHDRGLGVIALTGSRFSDHLVAGNYFVYGLGWNASFIDGLAGDDVIVGIGADDNFDGGAGDDRLIGGDGYDRLVGGPGFDECLEGETLHGCELM